MADLRWRIALLLIWLTVFYNIERLDISGPNTINLPSSAYAIAVFVALAPLLSFVQRRSVVVLIASTLAVYAIMTLAIDFERSWLGIHKFRTLAGMFLLVVTALLAHRVGSALLEFRQAVKLFTFSQKGGRVREHHDAEEMVEIELLGCRRKQRPLSLVLLQADASALNMTMHRLVQEIQRSMIQRYVLATTAGYLARFLRRTDIIIQDNKPGRLIFIAPETSGGEALAMGRRVARLAQEHLGVGATFSIASFPEQALTFEELLNVAEQRLREQPHGPSSIPAPEEELAKAVEQRAHDQRALPKPEGVHGD